MKTNLKPMRLLCKLGFHSFTDKPYNRTYLECFHCKSVLPGYKRVYVSKSGGPEESVQPDGQKYIHHAYRLEKETDGS